MLTTYLFRYSSECTIRSQIFKIFFASGSKGALIPQPKSCGRSCFDDVVNIVIYRADGWSHVVTRTWWMCCGRPTVLRACEVCTEVTWRPPSASCRTSECCSFPTTLSRKLTQVTSAAQRNCADTTGTVPVPWAGHFQCSNTHTHTHV